MRLCTHIRVSLDPAKDMRHTFHSITIDIPLSSPSLSTFHTTPAQEKGGFEVCINFEKN